MQTFAPSPYHKATATCLDNKRLNKQRLEVLQILRTLRGITNGWRNHPAVLMWEGHENALAYYGSYICEECNRRGIADNTSLITRIWDLFDPFENSSMLPIWWGTPQFHESHQAALLFKDPGHYSQFNWKVEPKIDYWWPTKHTEEWQTN